MNKNKFLVLLMIPLCASLGSCGGKESDEQYFSHFEPVVRFAVTSDAHISADKPQLHGRDRLKSVYKDTNDYAKTQKYKGFDHVIIAGDGSDDGSEESLNIYAKLIKEQSKDYNVSTHAILGNHELTCLTPVPVDYNTLVTRWKNIMGNIGTGEDGNINYHFTIGPSDNRFHFIMFSPNDILWRYDDDNLCVWLENEIKQALEDDPSKSRPIFVCQHIAFKDTVLLSDVLYMCKLDYNMKAVPALEIRNMLRKYPQVVDFSGHSHTLITDPRAVNQNGFTAIATGTLCYYNMDIVDICTDHIFPVYDASGISRGQCVYDPIDHFLNDDGRQFIIFEVDKSGASKMMVMDTDTHRFVGKPYYFRSFSSTKDFRYTIDRANTDPLVEFSEGATYSDPVITKNSVLYLLPHAKNAQHYRCSIFKDGKSLGTIYRLTDSWIDPQPDTFEVDFANLTPNTNYTIKVVPVNVWGREGTKPLTLSFKTTA